MKITEKELRQIVKEETANVMEENDLQEILPSLARMRSKAAGVDPRLFNKRLKAAKLLEVYEAQFVKSAQAYAKKAARSAEKLKRDLGEEDVADLAEVKAIMATMEKMVSIAERIARGSAGKFKASIDALRAEDEPAAAEPAADDDDREMSRRDMRMARRRAERTPGATEE
jgi:hypothetical protein|tara:strand:+ start:188 stop:700 length:513 start_codon:yes stop_codon:yes gene_type:complete